MMQNSAKLIKVRQDHFVVGIEESISEGDYGVLLALGHRGEGRGWFTFKDDNSNLSKLNSLCTPLYKITHSTQVSVLDEEEQKKVIKLDLSEVKALIGEVDVESKAKEHGKIYVNQREKELGYLSFSEGYKEALKDNADKRYTEFEVLDLLEKIARKFFQEGRDHKGNMAIAGDALFGVRRELKETLRSLDPKTEWDIEFDSSGKLKLK